ncbi:MAG: DUF4345 domain-containing protein [Pseudomonadota bacterium]
MAKLFVLLNAILFLGFGIITFFDPANLFVSQGIDPADINNSVMYELRSNYGGVNIGIGLGCAAAVLRPSLQRPALFLLLAFTGGYGLGRVLSLPFDGVPSLNLIGYACYEIVTATIAFLLLRSGKADG